jgi:small-conductance mechanosensitive channel
MGNAMSESSISKMGVIVRAMALLALVLPVRPVLGGDRLVQGEPIPIEAVADQQLEQQLAVIFHRIESFHDIHVKVNDGVVALGGKAAAPAAAEQAVDLAARFEGVVYVTDEIEVETQLDSRLTPAWRKISQTTNNVIAFLPLTAVALAIFAALYLLGRLLTVWEWPYRRFRDGILLKNLVRQLIRYAFVLAGVLIGLEILGLTALIGAVLGAAGLFGLALGFAFKDIVENYMAGFLLSIRSPFSFQDWIAVGGNEGSVVRVTSRELVLITLQGNHIRIPNAQVFTSVITNFTRNPLRRFDIEIGVGVAEDLSDVQRIGCSVLQAMKGVVADPVPTMRNKAFGASTMDVVFSGWVDQREADFLKVRSEAVRILKETLEQAGIDVPYPIQSVLSVEAQAPRPAGAKKTATEEDILQEAEHADVDRELHLDAQIERDRQTSDDVDLLPGKR